MTGPKLTPLADRLPSSVPFVGPETQERAMGRAFDARLGANESVFGPSPKAIAAMQAVLPDLWMYGDPTLHALRGALAEHHGVAPENIIIGEGIDGLLGVLCRLLVAEGTPVVNSDGAYPTFNFHVAGFGGRRVAVPFHGDHEDPEALIDAARASGAPLVYMSNPDNPMGTWHGAAVIQDMIARVPDGCVLCLDEAYAEFAPEEALPPLDASDPRVIRFRTFSKARGLAGLRVGYGIGHAGLVQAFDKVRNHFGVGRVAQAGALGALGDAAWLAHVRGQVEMARARIGQIAAANGLTALPSAANFVAVDCGGDGAFAKAVLDGLVGRGVFVRMPFVAPQTRCIRVSAGRPADLDALAAALPEALSDARAAAA
ncbi:MAG: pyridoxal phosphate-dependent aminotransferase [Pseudomonadota bacterium]